MALVILLFILFIVAITGIGFAVVRLYYVLYPKEQKYDFDMSKKQDMSKIKLDLYKVQKDIEHNEKSLILTGETLGYETELKKLKEIKKKLKNELERD